MPGGEQYRVKALEFQHKADQEPRALVRRTFQALTVVYLRLADQADRNLENDIVYEAQGSSRDRDPEAQ